MSDNDKTARVIELLQLGFSVSIDFMECKDDIYAIIDTARMFNSIVVLRNVNDEILDPKLLKALKSHSHKIIIES